MDIETWYGSSVRIPTFTDWRFEGFATSCIGLVKTIVRRKLTRDIHVRFSNEVSTACANAETSTILINQDFINGYFLGGSQLSSSATLSAILGVIVHEAAHFAYSPPTLAPYPDHIEVKTKCPFYRDVAVALGNIIEDIYIEAEVVREVPSFEWMLEFANSVMFRGRDLEFALSKVAHIESAPEDIVNLAPTLELLIQAKIKESISQNPYLDKLFALARSATELNRIEDRVELALKMYELVMEKMPKPLECDDSLLKDFLRGLLKAIQGITQDHSEESIGYPRVPSSYLNHYLEETDECEMTVDDSNPDEIGSVIYVEKPIYKYADRVVLNKKYTTLAEYARQRATVNKPYGPDRIRGNHIRKLYKIATDNKIFSEKMHMTEYKPMQVILLIDFSGSMSGHRIEAACSAAAGAAYGLVEGRCEVAVYGHTADLTRPQEVTMYRFKSFNESLVDLPARLFVDDLIELKENRDGDAIRFVGRKFASTKRKVLIVFSDGQPLAAHYSGRRAMTHTQEEVDKLRKRGIDVLSISITREANEANGRIYGREWNVYNEDPNVVEQVVRSLIGE